MEAFGDVRAVVPWPWSEAVLVAVSFLCGATVGIERERQDKPAGLRTLILICVGSTIFTMASMSPTLGRQEPARIAAQIVTGVGFLGAGSILRERFGVKGLTTAASIWAISAVGILVGAGYALAGFTLALSIVLTLTGVSRIENLLAGKCERKRVLVVFRPERGKTRTRIQAALDERRSAIPVGPERDRGNGTCELPLEICMAHRDHRALLAAIVELPGIEGLE